MTSIEEAWTRGFIEGRLNLLDSLILDLKGIKRDTEIRKEEEFGPYE